MPANTAITPMATSAPLAVAFAPGRANDDDDRHESERDQGSQGSGPQQGQPAHEAGNRQRRRDENDRVDRTDQDRPRRAYTDTSGTASGSFDYMAGTVSGAYSDPTTAPPTGSFVGGRR